MKKQKTKEVEQIINKLEKREISIRDIPEDYKKDPAIVKFERVINLRIVGKRGFDVISQVFFAEEELFLGGRFENRGSFPVRPVRSEFSNFDEYYDYLDGDIYENSCYTFCDLKKIVTEKPIDISRMMRTKSFVDYSIGKELISAEEREEYYRNKSVFLECQKWKKRFDMCCSYEELERCWNDYADSGMQRKVDGVFFLYNYIFSDRNSKERFNAIMTLVSRYDIDNTFVNALFSIYTPDDVLASFDYGSRSYSSTYRIKLRRKEYVEDLKRNRFKCDQNAYFDLKTHFYCEEKRFYRGNYSYPSAVICMYYETFDQFIAQRKGNLCDCDLFWALELDVDYSKYLTNARTRLPAVMYKDVSYRIYKEYDERFQVIQQWVDEHNRIIRQKKYSESYFFDFVALLKGDLSKANLLLCDGLQYLSCWDGIDFTGARMHSSLCTKFGLPYVKFSYPFDMIMPFAYAEQNERETCIAYQELRDLVDREEEQEGSKREKFYYIADLHLMHRIRIENCLTNDDVNALIMKSAKKIAAEAGKVLLLGGDISSEYRIFEMFIWHLKRALSKNTTVIVVLGNHELWSFPNMRLEEIVEKYRKLLDSYGMYLLHNDVFIGEDSSPHDEAQRDRVLKYSALCKMTENEIKERLISSRYVVFGGMGFSGLNKNFNATNGIYRKVVERSTELEESQKIHMLYEKLAPILARKNSVVLTHMPLHDWNPKIEYIPGVVYVSGHNHRNVFYDDGETRIYADNQIGYNNRNYVLKSFFLESEYDPFENYPDGIHQIQKDQYQDFHRGQNMSLFFSREIHKLFLLKKNGYYCFLHETAKGSLTILNGGERKKLPPGSIQYYYDAMDSMVSYIKEPINKYVEYQKRIAGLIRKLGGEGRIHGCIIDIDFYSHIFVNPFDGSIRGYWAWDMVDKYVFPSVVSLLKEKCPQIYGQYQKLLKSEEKNLLIHQTDKNQPQRPYLYLSTDIYKYSREIKKLQKIGNNILASWPEIQGAKHLLTEGDTSD